MNLQERKEIARQISECHARINGMKLFRDFVNESETTRRINREIYLQNTKIASLQVELWKLRNNKQSV